MTDSLIIFVLVLIAGSVLTLTVQGIKEAKAKALNGAKTAIKKNLDDKSKEILSKTHDDLDSYLTDVVEAEVRKQKKK